MVPLEMIKIGQNRRFIYNGTFNTGNNAYQFGLSQKSI